MDEMLFSKVKNDKKYASFGWIWVDTFSSDDVVITLWCLVLEIGQRKMRIVATKAMPQHAVERSIIFAVQQAAVAFVPSKGHLVRSPKVDLTQEKFF